MKDFYMSYNKHHREMHEMLREFDRVTGTGNMKAANAAMAKIVRSLVAMIESAPFEAKPLNVEGVTNMPVVTDIPKIMEVAEMPVPVPAMMVNDYVVATGATTGPLKAFEAERPATVTDTPVETTQEAEQADADPAPEGDVPETGAATDAPVESAKSRKAAKKAT